jgi:hypothetical protein
VASLFLCGYLNNVDISKPLWRAEPRDNPCVTCAFTSYISCLLIYLSIEHISCASASIYFGVLLLCAGTSLILLEAPVEVPQQVWFVLELVEGIYFVLVLPV